MKKQSISRWVCAAAASVALVGALGIVGCEQSGSTGMHRDSETWQRAQKTGASPHAAGFSHGMGRNVSGQETARPAPEPRAEQPRPAPAPRTGSVIAAYPTGHTRTPQLLVEKFAPAQVSLGEEFTYEYRLTNNTDSTIEDIVLTEQMSPNFKFASSDPAPTGQGEWTIDRLAPGESRTIRIRGSASNAQTIAACADVRYKVPLCSETLVVQPALQLALVGPATVLLCDTYNLEVTVRNTGTGVAQNVTVDVALPRGVTTLDGRTAVTLSAGDLAAGQAKSQTVQVKAAATGTYSASAKAKGGALTAEAPPVETKIVAPKLTIACEAPERRFVGRPVDFAVTVSNTGDAPATNTVVTQTIPAGVTIGAISDGGAVRDGRVVWNLGTLAPNASRKLTVNTTAASIGSVTANAGAVADCADPVSCPTTTSVEGIPALLLEGNDSPDPVEIGNTTTYTLVVTNQGSAALTGVKLVCMMDEGDTMEFVSASGEGGVTGTVQGRNITFPAIARLDVGRSSTYRIVIRAKNPGQVSFRAEATSNEITRPLLKVETTNFYR
ncbi:MAG TPA: hypothetical protein PLU35_11560 [Phycisphaerales bacterium]|nr:hypothetical protein [Phycisphaerales bacterium]